MPSTAHAVCRQCRREGAKLFLKGDRCYTAKCAFDRRSYAPGQHGQSTNTKVKEYGTQLREKQKMRRIYNVREKQFRLYYQEAVRRRGVTGENLMMLLEIRLDNAIYRMGFAASRAQSRELVAHGHFTVNGRKVNTRSYQLKPGDVVEVKDSSRSLVPILAAMASSAGSHIPSWLEVDHEKRMGKVLRVPTRDEIDSQVEVTLIVEFYSR
jgi:small subunit ribosomal protein S4